MWGAALTHIWPLAAAGGLFRTQKGANMEDRKPFSQFLTEMQNVAEKKAADAQEEAYIALGGAARRYWREIRKALLEEGVPGDLVEGATADFLSILAAAGRGK